MTATKSFYDVLVVGGSLGALAAGALLARRGFRVAWIRHDDLANGYDIDGATFLRAPDALVGFETPAFRRVLGELALTPAVRRKLTPLDPMLQVVLPRHRVDVRADKDARIAELAREFPEVHRPMEEFYAQLGETMRELDAAFAADAIWPPHGFLERRQALRVASQSALVRRGTSRDPLADFPADHPFRTFVLASTRFAPALDPDELGALALLRGHGTVMRGAPFLEGGRDALAQMLRDKILQHGGDLRPRDRVAKILVSGGRVRGLELATTDERLGCSFVLTAIPLQAALRLADVEPSRSTVEYVLGAMPRYHRFTLNVLLRAEGIPTGMASRVISVLDRSRPLCEENLLDIEVHAPDARGRVVVTAAALLPRSGVVEGDPYLRRQRTRLRTALGEVIPFLDRNVLVTDSPHDGLPPEGAAAPTWRPGAEPMTVVAAREPNAFLGVCGIPSRTELRGLILTGAQTLPGLGEEGEMLNALSVARIVTRTDRHKERLRRELWSKVET